MICKLDDYNITGTINALHNKNVTIILVIKHVNCVNMLQFLFVKQMPETGRHTYSKCASFAISTLMHSTLPALAALCMGVSPLASLRKAHIRLKQKMRKIWINLQTTQT